MDVTAAQVRAYRVAAQQLDRGRGTLATTAALTLGLQDARFDGADWSLANRGVRTFDLADTAVVWRWRGAPHLVRRVDLPAIAAASRPFSAADAAKRIFDAAKPLKAAGIEIPDALEAIGAEMAKIVRTPTVKGEMSRALNEALPPPYRRWCNTCQAEHLYEQPFRLAALPAGIELEWRTSPPLMKRIPEFRPLQETPVEFDPIRCYLHLLGPATPKQVAAYLDAPVKDVKAHWPDDVSPVSVDGHDASVLESDARALGSVTPSALTEVRLLGPVDPFLQARDRDVIVGADPARQKILWPTLGRPGAVLAGADVVGSWRPRTSGSKFRLQVELWGKVATTALTDQAERLAAFRGAELAGVDGL